MNTLVSIQESDGLSWILKNEGGKVVCQFKIGDKVEIIWTYGFCKDFIVARGNVKSIGHDTRADYISVMVGNNVLDTRSVMVEHILEMKVIK